MSKSELDNLELQIDKFIESSQRLTIENSSLHKKITKLNHERVSILDKKKKAAKELKAIITQLQDELSCQIQ